MSLKVLNEASLAYESSLQQRSSAASSAQTAACAGAAAVAASYSDAWEKFSLDGDRSNSTSDPHQPPVNSIKESSQL